MRSAASWHGLYDRGRRLARLRPLAEAWGQRLEAIVSRPRAPVRGCGSPPEMADYFVKAEIERLAAMAGEGAEPGDRNDRLRLELERLAGHNRNTAAQLGDISRSELDRLAALGPERLQREIVPGSWVGHVGGERRLFRRPGRREDRLARRSGSGRATVKRH